MELGHHGNGQTLGLVLAENMWKPPPSVGGPGIGGRESQPGDQYHPNSDIKCKWREALLP